MVVLSIDMQKQFYEVGIVDDAPNPRPGFETDLISEMSVLVGSLPPGTAQLRVTRFPNHPERTEPFFQVIPVNPKAASLKGVPIITDLNLTIGEASWREFVGFARGGTVVPGLTWQDELRRIWAAVVRGGFTENIYRDSNGQPIGWATKIPLNGNDLVIRNGRRRAKSRVGHRREQEIIYEPYLGHD